MRRYVIRLLTLAIYTTAIAVPMITADRGEANSGLTQKRHTRQSHGFRNSWAAEEGPATAPSYTLGGAVCPGNARSFDCKIWPPPVNDDPDRRGGDGGP